MIYKNNGILNIITIIIDQYCNSCLFGVGDKNISLRSDDERAISHAVTCRNFQEICPVTHGHTDRIGPANRRFFTVRLRTSLKGLTTGKPPGFSGNATPHLPGGFNNLFSKGGI